jgi:hypothetical protein
VTPAATRRFELRRALRVMLLPFRRELTESATALAGDGAEALVAYVLDPSGVPEPFDDQLAALVAGPRLASGRALASRLIEHRFAPRADDVVALAVAALEKSAQPGALEALFAQPRTHRSIAQCGRVLAWNAALLAAPIAVSIVDALVDRLAPVLGHVAATAGLPGSHATAAALRQRILSHARARLPTPEAAYVLGIAAPFPRDAFAAHAAEMLDGALAHPFIDGLVAAPHIPGLTDLARRFVADGDHDRALSIASRVPIDELADYLVTALDVPSAPRRALAVAAVELIRHDGVDDALAARLSDPSPGVAAAAAHALLGRGRRDLIARHSAREHHPVRRAIVLASLGEPSPAVLEQLQRGLDADRDAGNVYSEPSPLRRLIDEAQRRLA